MTPIAQRSVHMLPILLLGRARSAMSIDDWTTPCGWCLVRNGQILRMMAAGGDRFTSSKNSRSMDSLSYNSPNSKGVCCRSCLAVLPSRFHNNLITATCVKNEQSRASLVQEIKSVMQSPLQLLSTPLNSGFFHRQYLPDK
jgi:hypothetical protein